MSRKIHSSRTRSRLFSQSLLIVSAIIFLPGIACDPDVKQLGATRFEADPAFDPNGVERFELAYGFRSDSSVFELAAQGIAGSNGAVTGTCGIDGTNCVCDFFTDASGSGVVSSAEGSTSYNLDGNIIYCSIPATATASSFTHMRVRDRLSVRLTPIIKITSQAQEVALGTAGDPLVIQDVLAGLEAVRVRKVFEYRCFLNNLVKTSTTEASFSCSPDDTLSVVQIPYHFYLFADNLSNNFDERAADRLHPNGQGPLCGAIIRAIDCTTSADGATNPNALTLKFGLFSQNTGVFTVPIQLTSAPAALGGINSTYGFAAEVDSGSRCPPLFVKRQSYTAQPADAGDVVTFANTSVDADLVDTRILAELTTTTMTFDQYTGGSCTAGVCTSPNIDLDNGATAAGTFTAARAYTADTTSTVCVIEDSALTNL